METSTGLRLNCQFVHFPFSLFIANFFFNAVFCFLVMGKKEKEKTKTFFDSCWLELATPWIAVLALLQFQWSNWIPGWPNSVELIKIRMTKSPSTNFCSVIVSLLGNFSIYYGFSIEKVLGWRQCPDASIRWTQMGTGVWRERSTTRTFGNGTRIRRGAEIRRTISSNNWWGKCKFCRVRRSVSTVF